MTVKGPDPATWGEEQLTPPTDPPVPIMWSDLTAEERQRIHDEANAEADAADEAVDVTNRELWVDALDMACSEGVMRPLLRDRMLDYFDSLRPRVTQQPEVRLEVRYFDGYLGVFLVHDGPCVFVDGQCTCGKLDIGTAE